LKEPFPDFIKANLDRNTLVVTCGLPATYKTGIAEEISKMKGYPILRSDLIRLEVLKGQDVFDVKIAGNIKNRLSVYEEMFNRAEALAASGGVILDATFVTKALRERAAQIADRHHLALAIFETHCPQDTALERIKNRSKEKYESNALTEEAYIANKKNFQPVDVDAIKRKYPLLEVTHFVVDTCVCGMANWSIIKAERR
jgi:predicted kinase